MWGTEIAHILFQHKLFGPTENTPFGAPEESFDVPHLLGKDERKKGPTWTFLGGFCVKKGVPNGPSLVERMSP